MKGMNTGRDQTLGGFWHTGGAVLGMVCGGSQVLILGPSGCSFLNGFHKEWPSILHSLSISQPTCAQLKPGVPRSVWGTWSLFKERRLMWVTEGSAIALCGSGEFCSWFGAGLTVQQPSMLSSFHSPEG
jgi:hypothetical protein